MWDTIAQRAALRKPQTGYGVEIGVGTGDVEGVVAIGDETTALEEPKYQLRKL